LDEISVWEEIATDYLSLASEIFVIHFENFVENPIKDVSSKDSSYSLVSHHFLMQIKAILQSYDIDIDDERIECSLTQSKDQIVRGEERKMSKKAVREILGKELALREAFDSSIERVQTLLQLRNLPSLPVEKYALSF